MAGEMLRVVAQGGENGGPMVPHYESLETATRRFVGRFLDRSQGEAFRDQDTGQEMRHAVFVAHAHDEFHPETGKSLAIHEVPMTSRFVGEYIKHLRAGDLLPADTFTAELAGRPFDPTFKDAACGGVPVLSRPIAKAPAAPVAAPSTKDGDK